MKTIRKPHICECHNPSTTLDPHILLNACPYAHIPRNQVYLSDTSSSAPLRWYPSLVSSISSCALVTRSTMCGHAIFILQHWLIEDTDFNYSCFIVDETHSNTFFHLIPQI